MGSIFKHLTAALAFVSSCDAISASLGGPKRLPIDMIELAEARSAGIHKRDTDPSLLYPERFLKTPIDHFHNETRYQPHSSSSFDLRYWFDATYYKKGGPVIILQSGETDAAGRLPFLQNGLLHQLIEATNGIGVVLEHRYYGTSFPTPDLSVENMRFLTTEQAMADEAYFAQNVKFEGLEHFGDLTSKTTAYIGYGGSYAGAFNAFLRVQYPHVFWGVISSSGVTKAIWDYWQYFAPIAEYAPKSCIRAQQKFVDIVDNILIGKKNNRALADKLKRTFSLSGVVNDDDFTNVLSTGIQGWQSLNWDPELSSPSFYEYCDVVSNSSVVYPATESLRSTASDLIKEGGYSAKPALVNQMLNFIGYVNATSVRRCASDDLTQDECFNTHSPAQYHNTSLGNYDSRSWPYQYCNEYGFLQTGSGVPKNEKPLLSRLIDLEYLSIVCKESFGITSPPNTERVNKYGGYDISYPRLAIVDGEWDPWRPATPHAFEFGARQRKDTIEEPFILISKAVHHWDENGRFPNETTPTLPPAPVADAQREEVMFVKAWMEEWNDECARNGGKPGKPWGGWWWNWSGRHNGWRQHGNWQF